MPGQQLNKTLPEVFVAAGHIYCHDSPAHIWTVTGSGIAVTMFDQEKEIGGMAHYLLPEAFSGKAGNAFYARPSIICLFRFMCEKGARKRDLQVCIYGGAEKKSAPGFQKGLNVKNIEACKKVFKSIGVGISSLDIGGTWGRRIVFNTVTGESMVVKTNKIRAEDWYPKL